MGCEQCGSDGATTKSFGARALELCDVCTARYELQDILDGKTEEVLTLARQGRYQDAVELLEATLDANRARDKDGWLQWRVVSQQASILAANGARRSKNTSYCRHYLLQHHPTF